jgi:hypothetical protein
VAAHDWATWHHTIRQLNATCQQSIHPRVLPTMPTTSTATCESYPTTSSCMDLPCQHPYGLYGLHSQRPFFLPVWRFEQIAISLAPDVCLRRNELRWVHDDEGYALVRFEVIPRTLLIFELKFDPWSRF